VSCGRFPLVFLEPLRIHHEAADGEGYFGCSCNQPAEQFTVK